MQHVMIDLETMGTCPGCAIIAIGAVAFDPRNGDMDDGYYTAIPLLGQELLGLHIDADTKAWWDRQSEQARKVLTDPGAIALPAALGGLNAYLQQHDNPKVWGNGADFDNPILAAAYRAVDMKQGWKPYNGRCYRTVKNLAPHIKLDKRQGTHHHALDDAKSQAVHLMEIVRGTTLTLA